MNVWIDCYAPLVGRIFLGGFFLWNGIQAALNLPAAVGIFADHGVAYPLVWVVAMVAVEVLCGIAVVAGFLTRPAALVLALYLIVQSAFVTNFNSDAELNLLSVNLGLVGGLLYVAAYGTGARLLGRK
jgi:putative oxidoreductase